MAEMRAGPARASRLWRVCAVAACLCAASLPAGDAPAHPVPVEARVNALMTVIRTADLFKREGCILDLFTLGPAAEASVIDYLGDRDKSVVIAALKVLSFHHSALARDTMGGMTIHPNWEVRAVAIISLAAFNDPGTVARIADTLFMDQVPQVREAAAYALCATGSPAAIPALVKAATTLTGPLRDASIRSLHKVLANQALAPEIMAACRTGRDAMPRFLFLEMISGLGATGDRRVLPYFTEGLRDTDAEVRAFCAIGLGRIGDTRAVDALAACIQDPAAIVREHVKASLARLTNYRNWSEPGGFEAWRATAADRLTTAAAYEAVIAAALDTAPADWPGLFDRLTSAGEPDILPGIIARCLMSPNNRTVDFAMRCFERFPAELALALDYILAQGTTSQVLLDSDLLRGVDVAALTAYRYGLVRYIPGIIAVQANMATLARNPNLIIPSSAGYLCLRGLTGVDLGTDPQRWARWWDRNGPKLSGGTRPH
ncbi:MAG: HEAT repeat domain-containing protein [Planctomycetota bacterium]